MYKYWDNDKNKEVRLKKEDVITECFDQIRDRDIIYVENYTSGMGGSPNNPSKKEARIKNNQIYYIYYDEDHPFHKENGRGIEERIRCWQPHDGRKIIKDDMPYEI